MLVRRHHFPSISTASTQSGFRTGGADCGRSQAFVVHGEGQAAALDRIAAAEGVSRAELIREVIDRAISGHPGADLAADLAAINGSFGALAEQEASSRTRDQRTD